MQFETSKNSLKSLLAALLVMVLWGSLFPMIKIGYTTLGIAHDSISSILLFAGIRFTLCGSVALGSSFVRKDKIEGNKKSIISQILLIALFSIVLHYAFTYIGLSSSDSSKTALIKQIGSLAYICCAPLFFKGERFSAFKIIGAILGFCGIIAINYTDGIIVFTTADLLILAASACTVVSDIANKKVAHRVSNLIITGVSQFCGGIVLLLTALIMGEASISPTPIGIAVFCYICTASTVAYLLWSYVLRTEALSKMFIIKFAVPLFACVFSAILLGENILKIQYLLAFALISTGIMLANKEKLTL